MTGWWAPAGLYGLHVDLGRYSQDRGRWLRQPAARFTCRHGCHITAVGPLKVAALTQHIDEDHARTCPGNQPQNRNARA
ncbi:hypothetical protein C1I97_25150 [Streptomyces sp. NTH33]|uniref:hypothetical protein n=1 Tax=Streptomyces sp. NTH33 TaxID=1735453 RepID=UPI000DA86DE8|nr:hypothetical protein [Streptomyces sp. NTH33]PZG97825.1 hypothetical protein C1I97_25150 [Streptomyces sp. NTH33]